MKFNYGMSEWANKIIKWTPASGVNLAAAAEVEWNEMKTWNGVEFNGANGSRRTEFMNGLSGTKCKHEWSGLYVGWRIPSYSIHLHYVLLAEPIKQIQLSGMSACCCHNFITQFTHACMLAPFHSINKRNILKSERQWVKRAFANKMKRSGV